MTVKMIINTNRKSSTDLHLKQVEMVMRDLFLIEKYWAETNEKLPSSPGVWHAVYDELLNLESWLCKAISFIQKFHTATDIFCLSQWYHYFEYHIWTSSLLTCRCQTIIQCTWLFIAWPLSQCIHCVYLLCPLLMSFNNTNDFKLIKNYLTNNFVWNTMSNWVYLYNELKKMYSWIHINSEDFLTIYADLCLCYLCFEKSETAARCQKTSDHVPQL